MSDTDTILRILVVIGLLILIFPLLIMSIMWMMGGMMGPMGGSVLLGILPLLVAVVLGYGGYRLLTSSETESEETTSGSTTNPIEDLQEQYTEGELTEAEFEQKLEQQLDNSRPPE